MAYIEGPLPQRLKVVHGFGAVAFGVKDLGFSFFLLIFYNQVLGMDARLVSLALLIALLVDAVVDPIIGNLSDRTYTRWGRRLPWLYLAPIPLAIMWVLLWHPPGGEAPGFWGLVAIAVGVRVLLSACEVPSISLVPEITQDYDDRTTLFRYRFLSGWLGGIVMMVLAYTVFMSGPDGLLEQEGYLGFGIFGAVLMVLSVAGSALGQHRLVAQWPEKRPEPFSLRGAFDEIFDAFSERSFLFFAAGALAAYVNQGMAFSISNYLNVFVWQLDQPLIDGGPVWFTGLLGYALTLFLSVVLMFFVVGQMHRAYGKARSAAIGAYCSVILGLTPYVLLLTGLWPEAGSSASTFAFLATLLLANMFGVVMMISATSMIAEIVEAFEERTHRRAEGAFYSGNWLIQKCATGVGIFLTGQIVGAARLPDGARAGAVEQAVLSDMILYYAIAAIVLAVLAAFWLGRFPISREEHEARLVTLTKRRRDAIDAAARGDVDAGTIVP
ncbi:MFS transporter [Qipengyuania sp. 1NDH17]|uniref:MFS transporter n=1 Tax=Qipengyuania polymorpha TaxID=2867234 RepID=A0ABS7J3N1_9SPHN|nr:MFS transporter [Qipengyuania polymorpha]MBX7459116.1 MFS transporter [Qipengyuania polymorpha]